MSNHNYKQYYNNKPNKEQSKVQTPAPVVEEPEIPEVFVTGMTVSEVEEAPVSVTIAASDVEETVAPPVEPTAGTVVKCKMLNIRTKPNKKANVVTVVRAGSNLVIDMENSTADWYNVYTEAGIGGYCMKEFVEL